MQPNTHYRASLLAKADASFSGPITLAIESEDGRTRYATTKFSGLTPEWKRFQLTLKTGRVTPIAKARFVITLDRPGTVWFGLVSLFPPTWNDRPNGLRKDLMKMLVDLDPKFLRFPGGNYLEGDTIETRFEWKKTIGPIEQRPGHPCPWGYRSTDGMGLLEFLEWCEDMQAEPVLAVYAGYSSEGTTSIPALTSNLSFRRPWRKSNMSPVMPAPPGAPVGRRTATRHPSNSPMLRSATKTGSTSQELQRTFRAVLRAIKAKLSAAQGDFHCVKTARISGS